METNRNMTNLQMAKLLRAVAAALSLSNGGGNNAFRVTAYQRAADAIEHASSEIKDLWDDGELKNLAGVGENIARHLDELFRSGKVRHFEAILRPFPPAMFELLEIPGIGAKTAFKLAKTLGISKAHSAIANLEKAAKRGHIRQIEGFGEESEADILRGIKEYRGRSRRLLLPTATAIADGVVAWLVKIPQVKRADPLGSLRRQASTVGDVDIAAASNQPQVVIDHFSKYPKRIRVVEAGERTASIILPNDYQVDLMVQPPAAYGALLQHFTGSKHHNIALREYALKLGLSLSEYGIKAAGGLKQFANEEGFYRFLKLDWIPPELREGNEEIEQARKHALPGLVQLADIKGDLQIHSNLDVEPSHDSGQSSIDELVEKASHLGYQYIGLTEHNPSVSRHTPKQIYDLIKRKSDEIAHFNSTSKLFVFNGLEIDIAPDGSRALPDPCLDLLDFACVAIHTSFRLNRRLMTQRILAALDHPKIRFFAHPTGRILNQREGVELDWEEVFAFCVKKDKWLEVDGWPNRLDLPDTLVRQAIKHGVKLVVDTDSHAADQLPLMRYGVAVARRGWATANDIINTKPLKEIKKIMREVNNK